MTAYRIPDNTMTKIGFCFHFCSRKKQKRKIATSSQFMVSNRIGLFGQNADKSIEIPAEAIREITAGLREERIL